MTRSQSKTHAWLATAVLMLIVAMSLTHVSSAFAYKEETSSTPYPDPLGVVTADCYDCHGNESSATQFGKGPHAGYTTGSNRCVICHTVHTAPADSVLLLPKATVTATCEMCHDGTGGRGVYGAVYARTGAAPSAQHRVDQTNLVPGGNPSTGATSTLAFGGPNSTLGCSDCHSPHGTNTVAPFPGERLRVPYSSDTAMVQQTLSDRLLLQRPGNATSTPVAAYGSDWCIACHQGRMSGVPGPANNHPGDYGKDAFTYAKVAKLSQDGTTTDTELGPLAQDNRGYLMPYRSDPATRTSQQGDHKPICQQCHEDSRFVGTMAGAEASAAVFAASLDGTGTGGNPQFQNFPHETQNAHLLVEMDDDLCLNCHLPD